MSISTRTARSSDGVRIAYSVSGPAADAATLVLIHGGLADRSFWSATQEALADRFRIIALDLAGHGESAPRQSEWGIVAFARDVVAVVEAERVGDTILVGNSLGGAVAIEAAVLLGERVRGVIGVDTLHDLRRRIEPGQAREQAEAWRRDFPGMLEQMLRALFHPDVPPALVDDVRRRMARTPVATVAAMFESVGGYDTGAPARRLRVPVRAINGDLWATDIEANRAVVADFDAVILPHTGHYPMLECPAEFHCALAAIATAMAAVR